MPAPLLKAADFLSAFLKLLPRGPVWPRNRDSILVQTLAALMPTYERQAARSNNLLVDAFPQTTVELLPEWEASLGLPDPCAGLSPTIQARQQQVVARFAGRGGQSVAYMVQFAANLGYPITVTQFAPSRFGRPFGQPFGGIDWAFAWQVNAPTFQIRPFRFGQDAFGEPFQTVSSTVLLCEIRRVAPAYTTVLFNFS